MVRPLKIASTRFDLNRVSAMGFIFHLHCDSCGFVQPNIIIGLSAGCGSTFFLIQDQQSGAIRQMDVTRSDIETITGISHFEHEEEWHAATRSFVQSQLSPAERQVTLQEAFCPRCRQSLQAEAAGIA